jgi:magnesium transporter
MLETTIQFNKSKWIDIVNPSDAIVDAIIAEYGFHELDRDAIIEPDQTARVDTYEHYIFVVLHFPKYDPKSKRYLTNEFNIFLSKDYLITLRYYSSDTMDRLHEHYELLSAVDMAEQSRQNLEKQPKSRKWTPTKKDLTSGNILYEVIDQMLDKVFRTLDRFGKDLRNMEKSLFTNGSRGGKNLIEEMMIKKRNIITLKHMIKPQIAAIKLLELRTNSMFDEMTEAYFENLDDKVQKIASEIELHQENIESMELTLKTLFDLETNTTIKYLTVFSAFMLPLTLITSFFGMNIAGLPFGDGLVYWSIGGIIMALIGIVSGLKYFKKI